MAGQPIGDGSGGFLGDGFGSEILDGYPSAAPVPVPAGRLLALQAPHHYRDTFAGRAARRSAPPAGAAPATVPTAEQRLQRIRAAHFASKAYAGRAARQVSVGPPPPPPPPVLPSGLQQRLQARATHFAEPAYTGRRQNRFLLAYGGGSGLPPRASQIVAEALVSASGGLRASQIVAEALMQNRAGARVSQVILEALYAQDNPAYVRASQVVLEVLVPYTEMPVVPVYPALVGLTFDYVKRPKWSTGVGQVTSGREIRVGYWSLPQWEWDLSYDILADTSQNVGTTASDIKTLIGFVLSQFGAQAPFYFQDPDDNAVTGQVIGTGDGTTTTFQFVRTYGQDSGLGNFNGTEPIGGLNLEETLAVYVNGVVQESGITINNSTPCYNTVQFAVAPTAGQVITADFSFYYFCRLKDDSIDFNKFMSGLWNTKKLSLFSLKN